MCKKKEDRFMCKSKNEDRFMCFVGYMENKK